MLLPGPVDPALAERLDAALGLDALTSSSSYDLWQLAGPAARVRVIAPDGTVTTLAANPVSMSAASAPVAGGTLVLAEPYGGWTATLNGRALHPLATPVDGWAQGFVLPAGGGQLSVSRNDLAREASLLAELIVALAVCILRCQGSALTRRNRSRRWPRCGRRGTPDGLGADRCGSRAAPPSARLPKVPTTRLRRQRPRDVGRGRGARAPRSRASARPGSAQPGSPRPADEAPSGNPTARMTSARASCPRPFPRRNGPSARPWAAPA